MNKKIILLATNQIISRISIILIIAGIFWILRGLGISEDLSIILTGLAMTEIPRRIFRTYVNMRTEEKI